MPNNYIAFDDSRRQLFDYGSRTDGQPIYIGKAHPDTLASAAKWQIRKLTYDGNNAVTDISYADATNEFIKVWNDRAQYDYTPDS